MSNTVHAFDFLANPSKFSPGGITVLFGDEPFLKRHVLKAFRTSVLGESDEEIPFVSLEGREAQWRDVVDELDTISLFGSSERLVSIDSADDFVSRNRSELESRLDRSRLHGVLVLDVNKWAGNTRLYKAVDKVGLQIECRAPETARGKSKYLDEAKLCEWLISWSKKTHDTSLSETASETMLDLIGPEFGLLDQELAKLALFAGPGGKITPEMVCDVVGGWRTKTTWDLLDAAADGNATAALVQLDRLLQTGENPLALFGQISWSLRRFAAATRIFKDAQHQRRRISLQDALQQAGFRQWPKTALSSAERQLKQLGRERAGQFYSWLLEADLALKGSHSHPERARLVLERLFVRMSKQARNIQQVVVS